MYNNLYNRISLYDYNGNDNNPDNPLSNPPLEVPPNDSPLQKPIPERAKFYWN